jgi:hypothetical protein
MGQAASEGWGSFPAEPRRGLSSREMAWRGLSWIGGALATVAAVVLAAVLTVVFAATMAVIFVLTSALVGLYAVTHRQRRGVLIEARKVGHSWVAYSWDQRPR